MEENQQAVKPKTTELKTVAKSGFWYTASTFLTKALGFITIPIFSRILTPEQFGDFNNFAVWQVILYTVFSLEIFQTLNRARFDYDTKEKLDSYQVSSLSLSFLISGIAFLLFLAFPGFYENILLIDKKYIFIMFLYILFRPAFDMFQTKQRVFYRYKLSAGISFAVVPVCTIMALVLALTLPDPLFGRIFGQYIPTALVGVVFLFYYLKQSRKISLSCWSYALKLCIPLVITTLGSQLLINSDKIIAKQLCTAVDVAYLSIAASCANIMLILIQCLNYAWSPWLMDCLHTGDEDKLKKAFKPFLWGLVLLTAAILLLAPELVLLLGGEKYMPALYVFPAGMTNCILSFLTAQYVFIETYHKNVKWAGIATFSIALLNVGVGAIAALLFGYMAIPYAAIISNLLLLVMHKLILKRMKVSAVFGVKEIGPAVLVSILLIPIAFLLFQLSLPLRLFAALAVIGAVVYALRNTLKTFLKKLAAKKGKRDTNEA